MSAAEQLEQVITPSAPRAKILTPGARGFTGKHSNRHVPDPRVSPKHQKGTPSPRSSPLRNLKPLEATDRAIEAVLHWAQPKYEKLPLLTFVRNVAGAYVIQAQLRGMLSLIDTAAAKNGHKGYLEKQGYKTLGGYMNLCRREAVNLGAMLEALELIEVELLPPDKDLGFLPNYFWPRLPRALFFAVRDRIPRRLLAAFGREGRAYAATLPPEWQPPALPAAPPEPSPPLAAPAPPSVPAPADDPPKVSTPPPPPPPAPLPAVRIEPAPRGQLLARLTATRPGWAAQVQAVVDVFALYPEAYATLDETFADRLVRIARKGKWPLRQLLAGLEDAYDKAEDRLGSGLELRDWVITCLKKPRAGTLTASARAIAERAETTIAAARATAAAARPAAAPRAVPVAETPAAAPARVPSADELLELVRRQPGGTLNLGDLAGDLMGPFTRPRFPGVAPAQLLPVLRALETRGLVRSEPGPTGTRYWPALDPPPLGGAPAHDGP